MDAWWAQRSTILNEILMVLCNSSSISSQMIITYKAIVLSMSEVVDFREDYSLWQNLTGVTGEGHG